MNRLQKTWHALRESSKKALIPFITAGDPDLATTGKLILALSRAGADIIELGVPFSDPMADGPVIQAASGRALHNGVSLKKVLGLVDQVRCESQVPLLLMGYYNPIFAYGVKRFADDAAKAGVDAVLVVDLPPEESKELDDELKRVGIDLIYLLAPTSDEGRIRLVASRARGFVYFVSVTGITGASLKSEDEIAKKVTQIRCHTVLPVVVGFGISKPEQAQKMARIGDGVVIGSALVSLIHEKAASNDLLKTVEDFIGEMKKGF